MRDIVKKRFMQILRFAGLYEGMTNNDKLCLNDIGH